MEGDLVEAPQYVFEFLRLIIICWPALAIHPPQAFTCYKTGGYEIGTFKLMLTKTNMAS